MYPISPYAEPYGSYTTPVDPPSTGPFDAPTYQVCINRDWLPFLAGSLKQLLLQSTWNVPNDAALLTLQGQVFDLISAFAQVEPGCGIYPPSHLCISGDFTQEDLGFIASPTAPCAPVYVLGTGWQSCFDTTTPEDILSVDRVFAGSGTFVKSLDYHVVGTGIIQYTMVTTLFQAGIQVFQDTTVNTMGGAWSAHFTPNINADRLRIDIHHGSSTHLVTLTLDTFGMCYVGDFPLSRPAAPPQTVQLYTLARDHPLVGPDADGYYTISSVFGGGTNQVIDLDTLPNHTYVAGGPFGHFEFQFISGTVNYADWNNSSNAFGGGGGSPPSSSLCLWRVFLANTANTPFSIRVRATPC